MGRGTQFIAAGLIEGLGRGILENGKQVRAEALRQLERIDRARENAEDRMLRLQESAANRAVRREELTGAREDRKLTRDESERRHRETLRATQEYRDQLTADRADARRLEERRIDLSREKNTASVGEVSAADMRDIDIAKDRVQGRKGTRGLAQPPSASEIGAELAAMGREGLALKYGWKPGGPEKLTIGQVVDGFRYRGGPPSEPSSWEEVR